MEKQTKNIITREWVEKELRFYNKADIRSTLFLMGVFFVLFIPLAAVAVSGVVQLVEKVWLEIVLSVLFAGFMYIPVWAHLFVLTKFLRERKLLLCGDFDIVTRAVSYKSEKLTRRNTEELLHFSGFKEISVGHTEYQLASQGDEFYIVHYKGSDAVKLLYSSKMYEYIETQSC
ncbi:MAG: hypothetical protein E7653_07500 [Ruminococcaceae bacterium]|nr:hypothetical protein [Oscillospiraceae bacterium]